MASQPHPSGVSDGNYPSLPQALVDELQELVRGEVFARTDKEFKPSTTIFNGNVVTPANAVVIPANTVDVSKILEFCTKHSLYPSIKAGGYGTAGWAINGDIVIDLSKLNGLDIEPPLAGDKFTRLQDMPDLDGDARGKTKFLADSSDHPSTFDGVSTSNDTNEDKRGSTGKRRRSVDLAFDPGSGYSGESSGLPRDPFVAKFLHGDDLPSPAVRRRLDVVSPAGSNSSSSSTSKVNAIEVEDGGIHSGHGAMRRQLSSDSEKTGRTLSNDGSMFTSTSTSTSTSIFASNSSSTAFTTPTPTTAPTSPRPKASDADEKDKYTGLDDASDVAASVFAGLSDQPEVTNLPQRSAPAEESPLQSRSLLVLESPTTHAEPPPPPSRTPSFSVRSEDPFGYMSAPSSAPAPVLGVRSGVPPPRGYEQPAFEVGSSNDSRPPIVPAIVDSVDSPQRPPFLSDAMSPAHPHAYVSFGAGVKQKDIDIFTAGHPLPATSPNGNVGNVAYHIPLAAHPVGSSVMLLGGFGFLSRLYGLSIDALVEVEMVLADGSIVYVNEEEHPDLWWSIRGAGPAFGVVTRYKAKAYPVPVVFAGNLIYNFHASTAASLIKHFRDCVKSAPRELYANVLLTAGPADKGSLVVVQLCYIGNRERGRKFLEAIASWDGEACLLNEVSEKSFLGQQDSVAQILRGKAGRQWFIRSALITSLPDEVIHKTVNEFADTPVGCTWLFELAGGAVADADDTCFPKDQREASFTIAAFHQWELDDDDPLCVTTAEHWIEKTLEPVSTGGPYPAFLGRHESASRVIGSFGSNWERLCEIKKKYDPNSLFRHNFWPLDSEGNVSEPCEREPKSPILGPHYV